MNTGIACCLNACFPSGTTSTGLRFLVFLLLLALGCEQEPSLVIVAITLVLICESWSAHDTTQGDPSL